MQSNLPLGRWQTKIKGIGTLLRPIPLITWGGGTIILGLGWAYNQIGLGSLRLPILASLIFLTVLLQGVITHALNDLIDWRSGTDQIGHSFLSGGSGSLHQELLSQKDLSHLSFYGSLLFVLFASLLAYVDGDWIIVFALFGLWGALFYSLPPLQLAYRPFLGELFALAPTMLAAVLVDAYALDHHLSLSLFLLAGLNTLICLGSVMVHHLRDIPSDLKANPPKWTTPAYFSQHFSWPMAKAPAYFYYALAFLLSLWLSTASLVFLFSSFMILLSLWSLKQLDVQNKEMATQTDLTLKIHAALNAWGLGIAFLLVPSIHLFVH